MSLPIHLTLIDGPYGMGKYAGDEIRTVASLELYRGVLSRACRDSQNIVLFGTFDSLAWIHESCLISSDYLFRADVVWHKPDWVGGAIKNIKSFSPRHELFLHYSIPDAYFDADSIRVPYGDRAQKGVAKKTGRTHGWVPNPLGARCGDVISIVGERLSSKVDGRTQPNAHSCQKPDELLDVIVKSTTPVGGIVHEPFRGSDNLERVCSRLERTYQTWPNAQDYADELSKSCTAYA